MSTRPPSSTSQTRKPTTGARSCQPSCASTPPTFAIGRQASTCGSSAGRRWPYSGVVPTRRAACCENSVHERRPMSTPAGPSFLGGWSPRGRHLFLFDILAVGAAIVGAFGLRFDANNVVGNMQPYLPVLFLPLVAMPPGFIGFGLYRREWRYASRNEMVAITAAILVGTGITFAIQLVLGALDVPGTLGFPRSVFVIEALLLLALVGGSRFALPAGIERSDRDRGDASK